MKKIIILITLLIILLSLAILTGCGKRGILGICEDDSKCKEGLHCSFFTNPNGEEMGVCCPENTEYDDDEVDPVTGQVGYCAEE